MSCRYYPDEVEVWKDIPGWVGYYQASTHGRVRSLARLIKTKDGRLYPVKSRILKPGEKNKYGCRSVALSKNSNPISWDVHKCVSRTFIGPCPDGMECCHNDGKPWNCYENNLRYDTHQNNIKDAIVHGTTVKGTRNGRNKHSESKVIEIKQLLAMGLKAPQISKKLNIPRQTINSIEYGRNWSWLKCGT